MKRFSILFLLFLILSTFHFSLSTVAFGHATGSSWEQVYGDYKVDVGYDPTTFTVGEPQRLDFNVVKEQGGEDVQFADVWVRISQGNKTVFASGIHKPSLGKTGMTFTFPEAGDYMLSARFEGSSGTVVESSFPVTVQALPIDPVAGKSDKNKTVLLWAGWIVAAVGFGLATYVFLRKKKTL